MGGAPRRPPRTVRESRLPHPLIHILLIVVIAGGCARGGWADLGLALAVTLAGLLRLPSAARRGLWGGVRHLRFFLLALIVLYGWFQPGERLWPAAGGLSPTAAGMGEGALRAAVLVVMVIAVHTLMQGQGEGRVLAGLTDLLRPLRRLGLPTDRFALRLVLALRLVPGLRTLVSEAAARAGGAGRWRRLGQLAADVYGRTLARAESAPAEPVTVPDVPPPARWQWLAPTGLAMAFWGLS